LFVVFIAVAKVVDRIEKDRRITLNINFEKDKQYEDWRKY